MKRYDNVEFGIKSKLYDYFTPPVLYGKSVTDDSHFVPRVKQVRDFVASGGAPSSDLRYDSTDSPNSPVLVPKINRSVTIDPVDADNALQEIVSEAKAARAKKDEADKEAALNASLQEVIKGDSAPSDAGSEQ